MKWRVEGNEIHDEQGRLVAILPNEAFRSYTGFMLDDVSICTDSQVMENCHIMAASNDMRWALISCVAWIGEHGAPEALLHEAEEALKKSRGVS